MEIYNFFQKMFVKPSRFAGFGKSAGKTVLRCPAVLFIVLLSLVPVLSCLKPVDHSDDSASPPVSAFDDPDQGTMSRATADHIFHLRAIGDGLEITGFKSASWLASYLLRSSSRAVITVSLPDAFRIYSIGGLPLIGVADGAFAPSGPGGEDDISEVIRILGLPPTIQFLGDNLFEKSGLKVKTPVFLDIPVNAPAFRGMDADALKAKAAAAAGLSALARTCEPGKPPQLVMPSHINEFIRPAKETSYTVGFYDEAAKLVSLSPTGGGDPVWRKVTEPGLQKLFNGIYTPNAPDSAMDEIEKGKTAAGYSAAVSRSVLGLFKITIGAKAEDDKVEIMGDVLPGSSGVSRENPVIIDVGYPGADNAGLPKFSIPYKKLGLANGSYAHIRFRVNKGAHLIIEADNSAYLNKGAGNPCESGYFKDGCVEVMAGGKLRDSAYEGFPLGPGAVILSRNNSYLAVGPEQDWEAASGPGIFYAGWLIGSSDTDGGAYGGSKFLPRIVWDSGNTKENYIEVRQGKIALNAKVTARRSFALIYSVWFVEDAALTIAIPGNENPVIFGSPANPVHGIFADELSGNTDYNFYGNGKAAITIFNGNALDGRFLKSNSQHTATVNPVVPSGDKIILRGKDEGTPVDYADSGTGIKGYLNWY
ncbi:MAG: hypothetical protein LBH57_07105 [Treponema sp.]|jgi:hypothetical protein|nr:hypothetical protein [Treponema sp.]